MKPYPFAGLNHLTMPLCIVFPFHLDVTMHGRTLCGPRNNLTNWGEPKRSVRIARWRPERPKPIAAGDIGGVREENKTDSAGVNRRPLNRLRVLMLAGA